MAWLFGDVGVRNLNETNGRSVRVIPALLLNIFHHILEDYVQTALNWSQHCSFCTKVMDSSHCNTTIRFASGRQSTDWNGKHENTFDNDFCHSSHGKIDTAYTTVTKVTSSFL